MANRYDVGIIGGAGHIGAPLAIVLASKGFRVLIVDINQTSLDTLARGEMPFLEEGGEPLLKKALSAGLLGFSRDYADIRGVPAIIVTIGTPIDEFHNPGLTPLLKCVEQMSAYLADDQTIILRSTVAPGVTEVLDRQLRARGLRTRLAFCPERVAQGKAIEEIQNLPQLVSGTSREAVAAARRVFERVTDEVIELQPLEAEYAKLLCNAYRYIQFAATNQLYMMVQRAGLDYNRLLAKMKKGYPRMQSIPGAGFAAGPCLMKDTMQLFAHGKHNFILGQVAMAINEGMPNFIVETLGQQFDLPNTTVGILGMAFKAESDDIRDALSYKLGKVLRFSGAKVLYSDEFVRDPTFISKERLIAEADVVIVGVPHAAYRELTLPRGKHVVDVWGIIARTPDLVTVDSLPLG